MALPSAVQDPSSQSVDEKAWLRRTFVQLLSGVHVTLLPVAVFIGRLVLGPELVTNGVVATVLCFCALHAVVWWGSRRKERGWTCAAASLVLAEALPIVIAWVADNPLMTLGLPMLLVGPVAAASPLLSLWASPAIAAVNVGIIAAVFRLKLEAVADPRLHELANIIAVRAALAMGLIAAVGFILAKNLKATFARLQGSNATLQRHASRQALLAGLARHALTGERDVAARGLAALRESLRCGVVAWAHRDPASRALVVDEVIGCETPGMREPGSTAFSDLVAACAASGSIAGIVATAKAPPCVAGHRVTCVDLGEHVLLAGRADEAPFTDEEGQLVAGVASILSTAAGRDAARMREEVLERRFSEFVRLSPDGVISIDARGVITSANETAERVTGYGASELVGRGLLELQLIVPEDRERALDILRRLVAGEAVPMPVSFGLRRKDGVRRVIEVSSARIATSAGACEYFGVVRDVTDRERIEAQLRSAQSLDALGQLAGGVAHDFNNLLTAVLASANVLADDDGMPRDARELGREILAAGERGAALTRKLLAFSRQQALAPRVVEPDALLRGLGAVLRRILGEHVDLLVKHGAGGACVRVDATQLEQAFVNLCVNARDAMPGGGKIVIETGTVGVGAPSGALPGVDPGRWVVLSVADTGHGMTPEVVARIFEPFFTTKPVGQGTGLGLAMVHGFVKQSGGTILCDSTPGRGTVFRMVLPLADEQAAPEAELATYAPVAHLPKRAELGAVLVVDDDDLVRKTAVRVLQGAGYRVESAPDPEVAIRMLAERRAGYALVLTDVVMPRMSGPELAHKLEVTHPALPVLFMSGYTRAHQIEEAALVGKPLIEKPFSPASLVAAVDGVLRVGAAV